MTNKKVEKKSETKINSADSIVDKVVMLAIPEVNLRLVYEWIESENMTMPHSQVIQCLKLLATATVVKD